jgi:exodeoxyribonuclease VII large subunit
MPEQRPETVLELTRRIKLLLESTISNVWVEGEVSNLTLHASGHAYFSLKDANSQISCTIFGYSRSVYAKTVPLKNGLKLRARGSVSVYEPRGSYQLNIRSIEPSGEGDLMLKFLELKNKLASEGIFDAEHKRSIPAFTTYVGIVTSPTGAVIRDMLNVTRRRFPNMHIVLAPARVQGEGAAEEIVEGIELLNSLPNPPSVIIVGRGGGSMEDLWCFNEEIVARAVYASKIPVISAVGHETDFTICDFAADLRVPTPSAAAEMVCGQMEDLLYTLHTANQRISNAMGNRMQILRSRLKAAADSRLFTQPAFLINQYQQHVDMLSQQIHTSMTARISDIKLRLNSSIPAMLHGATQAINSIKQKIERTDQALSRASEKLLDQNRHKLDNLSVRLESVNPKAVLARGYGIVTNPATGKTIRSIQNLTDGTVVKTELADGTFQSIVSSDASVPRTRRTLPYKKITPPPQSNAEQMTLDF